MKLKFVSKPQLIYELPNPLSNKWNYLSERRLAPLQWADDDYNVQHGHTHYGNANDIVSHWNNDDKNVKDDNFNKERPTLTQKYWNWCQYQPWRL